MLTCGVADLSFPRVAAARGGFFCRPERSEGNRPRRDPSLGSGRPKAAVPDSGGLIRRPSLDIPGWSIQATRSSFFVLRASCLLSLSRLIAERILNQRRALKQGMASELPQGNIFADLRRHYVVGDKASSRLRIQALNQGFCLF